MGQEKRTGEFKKHTKFRLETATETGILGDLGLLEMLKDIIMKWTQKITISVAFRSVKYKFSLRYTRSANGRNMSVFHCFYDLRYYTELYAVNWTLLLSHFSFRFVVAHGVPTLHATNVM